MPIELWAVRERLCHQNDKFAIISIKSEWLSMRILAAAAPRRDVRHGQLRQRSTDPPPHVQSKPGEGASLPRLLLVRADELS